MSPSSSNELLTPAQVAKELQVTVVTVRRWIASGSLHARKIGPRRWMVRRVDLDEFTSGATQQDAAPEPSEDPSFRKHLVMPGER